MGIDIERAAKARGTLYVTSPPVGKTTIRVAVTVAAVDSNDEA